LPKRRDHQGKLTLARTRRSNNLKGNLNTITDDRDNLSDTARRPPRAADQTKPIERQAA